MKYGEYVVMYQNVCDNTDELLNRNLDGTLKPYPINMNKLFESLGVTKYAIDNIETKYAKNMIVGININYKTYLTEPIPSDICKIDGLDNTIIDTFEFLSHTEKETKNDNRHNTESI